MTAQPCAHISADSWHLVGLSHSRAGQERWWHLTESLARTHWTWLLQINLPSSSSPDRVATWAPAPVALSVLAEFGAHPAQLPEEPPSREILILGNTKGQDVPSGALQKGFCKQQGTGLPWLRTAGSVAFSHFSTGPGCLCASYEETSSPASLLGDRSEIALGNTEKGPLSLATPWSPNRQALPPGTHAGASTCLPCGVCAPPGTRQGRKVP